MPCSRKEALARLFIQVTSTIKFFFLFFYFFSLFLAKLFTSLFSFFYFLARTEDEDDDGLFYGEEDQEEEEYEKGEEEYEYLYVERDHLVADVLHGDEDLVFLPKDFNQTDQILDHDSHNTSYDSVFEDPVGAFDEFDHDHLNHDDHDNNDGDVDYEVVNEDEYMTRLESNPYESCETTDDDEEVPQRSPTTVEFNKNNPGKKDDEKKMEDVEEEVEEETKFTTTRDEKFLIFDPPKSEAKKSEKEQEKEKEKESDSYSIGSTSKSTSEWKSSIKDSDPFSSSSRRSCPKWESYAVYHKYDQEMTFLDTITAQKLHETESLRSFQVQPRSISQRIVHKLANNKKQRSKDGVYQNPYSELEAAYVAQICLTWEALNWNYVNFQRKRTSNTEIDPGCPAQVAQEFQQFQVLLLRFIENEPYERGQRPEIYARMRRLAPKLLQVPEYHDYEEEDKGEVTSSRITSTAFRTILDDAIRTFMNFLKADRESHCQVLTAALFKRRRRGTVDPTHLHLVQKINKKKKVKLKDLQRSGKCFRKRKITKEEEMQILMGLIDIKVVSRVLRMTDITQEQLHWCEEKMGKVRVLEGKLHRDSSPLFFPAH